MHLIKIYRVQSLTSAVFWRFLGWFLLRADGRWQAWIDTI